jgi:hypothetical protein
VIEECRKRAGDREGDTIVGKELSRVDTLVHCKSCRLRMRYVGPLVAGFDPVLALGAWWHALRGR